MRGEDACVLFDESKVNNRVRFSPSDVSPQELMAIEAPELLSGLVGRIRQSMTIDKLTAACATIVAAEALATSHLSGADVEKHRTIFSSALYVLCEDQVAFQLESITCGHGFPLTFKAPPLHCCVAAISLMYAIKSVSNSEFNVHEALCSAEHFGYSRAIEKKKSDADIQKDFARQSIKKLIDARHDENRKMKREVLDWWELHKNSPEVNRNKDRAADLIAHKVVPLSWRTVRDHLKGA